MRIICSLLAVAVVGTVALIAWGQDQDQPKPISVESKLLELLKERRQTLHQAVQYQKAQFEQGSASLEDVLEAEVAIAQADLEIAPTLATRQHVHQRLIKQLRQLEELAQARFAQGTVTQLAVFDTKAARLQAEIDMLQDRTRQR
ncbi:hypothetical protein AB1K70_11975 [Bremerella sp. JC770]|uniref:hypothetical protein n=1 Tax=Bremerella sp. JC770 TaxID=3232137 RepID=UPI00345A23BD